jgi:hypothetical protein
MDACFGTLRDGCGVVLVRGTPIAPVIPASGGLPTRGRSPSGERRVLPVSRLAVGVREGVAVYGIAAVDHRGRIADRAVLAALGWSAGTRLSIREAGGLIILAGDPQGVFAVSRQQHLYLPVGVRRWCALIAGDRVLLAAEPEQETLVVYPPAVVDDMVRRFRDAVSGGEQS